MKERILETADRLFYLQGIRADRRRHHRGRNRHQQAHALQSLSVQGRADLGLSGAALRAAPRASDKPPVEQILGTFDSLERRFSAKDFRGCPFVNAVAELGTEDQSVRKIAVAFKESRRLWFRDLLVQLGVTDAEGLATQLALAGRRLDRAGPRAQRPGDGARGEGSGEVLLRNAGVKVGGAAGTRAPKQRRS